MHTRLFQGYHILIVLKIALIVIVYRVYIKDGDDSKLVEKQRQETNHLLGLLTSN